MFRIERKTFFPWYARSQICLFIVQNSCVCLKKYLFHSYNIYFTVLEISPYKGRFCLLNNEIIPSGRCNSWCFLFGEFPLGDAKFVNIPVWTVQVHLPDTASVYTGSCTLDMESIKPSSFTVHHTLELHSSTDRHMSHINDSEQPRCSFLTNSSSKFLSDTNTFTETNPVFLQN